MFFCRSLLASAIVISISASAQAAVLQRREAVNHVTLPKQKHSGRRGMVREWLRRRQEVQEDVDELMCRPSLFWNILLDNSDTERQEFCNKWLGLPPATTEVDITSTSTKIVTSGRTDTMTITSRTTTTSTLTETTTLTPVPSIVPRAANAVAAINQAELIISSVIAGEAVPSTAYPIHEGFKEAVRGLSTVCLCLHVAPTSTVTLTHTAPPVQITYKAAFFRQATETTTKLYTTTATEIVGMNETIVSRNASHSTTLPSGGSSGNGSPQTSLPFGGSSTVLPSTTALSSSVVQQPSDVLRLSSNSSISILLSAITPPPTLSTSAVLLPLPTGPVAIGLPFKCPGDAGNRISNIFNDKRYEYEVICDKTIASGNEIVPNEAVDPTGCAAECSYMNDAFSYARCGGATFTTSPGSTSGTCLISGSTQTLVDSPGSVTVILTGIFTHGNEKGVCSVIDLTTLPSNVSTIDTSSLIASVTATRVSVSTPGFITSSGGGGEFRTFTSANTTDSNGIVHWSWVSLYASSSSWYAVYGTSWSCNYPVPRTIIERETLTRVSNGTSVNNFITTIVRNGVTTVQSGNSTTFITAGNGQYAPTAVTASTTIGEIVFTTRSSIATQTSISGSGSESTSLGIISSGALSSLIGFNTTTPSFRSTAPEALNSTSIFGSSPQSVTSGAAQQTVGGNIFTANSTGGFGTIAPVATSGSVQQTVGGNSFTASSTKDMGSIVSSVTSRSLQQPVGGETFTANFTGGFGSITTSATNRSAYASPSSATTTYNDKESNGSGGSLQATRVRSNSSATGRSSLTLLTSGGAGLSANRATFTFNSTGGRGSIFPATSLNGTGMIIPSLTTGSQVLTVPSNSSIPFSTGTGGSLVRTESGGIATKNSIGDTGSILPATSSAVSAPGTLSTQGAINRTSYGATFFLSQTGGTGSVLPTVIVTIGPTPRLNVSLTPVASTSTSITQNATFTHESGSVPSVPPLVTSIPISNASSPVSGSFAGTSGAANLTTSGDVTVIISSGATGAVSPSSNVTATLAPSLLPTPNNKSSTAPFTNSADLRSGKFSRTTQPNITVTGTAPIGILSTVPGSNLTSSGTVVVGTVVVGTVVVGTVVVGTVSSVVTINSTALPGTGVLSSSERNGYPEPTFSVTVASNTTSTLGTGLASVTTPPTSANASYTLPVSNTTDSDFSNIGGNRLGSFSRIRTSGSLSGFPTPLANRTVWPGTAPTVTASSLFPIIPSNSSLTLPLGTGTIAVTNNSTSVSAGIPSPLSNGTTVGAASLTTLRANFNSTSLYGSGASTPVVLPPSVIVSSGAVEPSANSSGLSSLPYLPLNTGLTVGTGSITIPVSANISTAMLPTGYPVPSSGAPLILVNASTPVGSSGITNFSAPSVASSSLPLISDNGSAPASIQFSGTPSPTGNLTSLLVTGRTGTVPSGQPYPSANSTVREVASVTPTALANVTIPLTTGGVPLSTGATASYNIPALSHNSTIGYGSTGVVTPSTNAISPTNSTVAGPITTAIATSSNYSLASGTGTVPSAGASPSGNFSNIADDREGRFRSSGTALTSANSTRLLPTGSRLVISSVTPKLSLNSSALPLGTDISSSIPSVTPTPSLNGTNAACPTVSPSISIETILITHTILPSVASTCVPSASSNSTFAFPSASSPGPGAPTQPTYSSTTTGILASASSTLSRFRRSGTIATADQVAAACADTSNNIFNPGFEIDDDNDSFGWTSKADDSFISFRTFPSSSQHTKDGQRSGRILAAAPGRSLMLSQPLTLCPGKQYRLDSWNKQGNVLAQCALEYSIGDKVLATVTPEEAWLEKAQFYTAGTTAEDVSVDLKIRGSCAGLGGATVGTDEAGYMVFEIDDLSLLVV